MRNRVPFRHAAAAVAGLTAGILVFPVGQARADGNFFEQILAAMGTVQSSLAAVAGVVATTGQDVLFVRNEITHPVHGLAGIRADVRSVQETLDNMAPPDAIRLTTGVFSPRTEDDFSVGVYVVNNSDTAQSFGYTLYEHRPIEGRTVVAVVDESIAPGRADVSFNAIPGPIIRRIEVVFHATHPDVVPTVTVGTSSAFGGSNINQLYPGDMARLR